MSVLDNLIKGNPILIKEGQELPVKILSNNVLSQTQTIKSRVHKLIGNEDSYEFIGIGDRKLTVPFYFDNQDDYQNLIDFIKDGSSVLLVCDFFPLEPIKIDGDIKLEPYYNGWGTATINFTTAIKDFEDKQNLLSYYSSLSATSTLETKSDKKTFLDKMNNWANKVFKTVSKGNEFVGNVTNNVSAYSAAFTNVLSGISSGASIVTSPISSIKQNISDVTSGLSSVISSLQNVVLTIKQTPNDIQNLIDNFSLLGDQLNNLFDLGNKNESLKYNTDFLIRVSDAIINIDLSQDNQSIINSYDNSLETENIYIKTEYFLPSLTNKTNEAISVLTLCSILLNLYGNSEKINRWNTIDLENLRKKTETLYNYISTFEIDTELSLELDLARNRFFKIFKILWDKAYKIEEFTITEPNFLENLVFSVNGNLDFYEDTKKLNNVIGGIVQPGTVMVITND
jgi:hypothetical protein